MWRELAVPGAGGVMDGPRERHAANPGEQIAPALLIVAGRLCLAVGQVVKVGRVCGGFDADLQRWLIPKVRQSIATANGSQL